MRESSPETESILQQFGEFLLQKQLVRENAARFAVGWVRRFLQQPATDVPLADRVRLFREDLERAGRFQDWQIRQAEQALRIYFANFLGRTDWSRHVSSPVIDERGAVDPFSVIAQLRLRLRTRHYSYRTESTYVDWVRRFLDYLGEEQGTRTPAVDAAAIRNVLTHLAAKRGVSASTQNQALSALLLLSREVLSLDIQEPLIATRARAGHRLPVVLSVPETAALLAAMHGTPALMASLIYGGGLRVSECCQLRVKDIDFDQGLIFVRSGRGDKDRSTLLPVAGRDRLCERLRACEALHREGRQANLAGVWMPDALERKYPNAGKSLGWFWVFPSRSLSTDPRAGIVRRHHLDESVVQKAVHAAANTAGICKRVSVHTHVVRELRTPARSPLDMLR